MNSTRVNYHILSYSFLISFVFLLNACSGDTESTIDKPPADKTPVNVNAEAGPVQSSNPNSNVQLDGSASQGTKLIYHWTLRTLPDGSVAGLTDFEAAAPQFNADQAGSYVAQLVVIDSAKNKAKDFTVVNVAASQTELSQNILDHIGNTQSCQSCHNGTNATGRSPTAHIAASEECAVCHSINNWSPVSIDHNEIFGTCSFCHDGSFVFNNKSATTKPDNHIVTSAECNQCHVAGTSFSIVVAANQIQALGINSSRSSISLLSDDDHPPIGEMMCVDCHDNVTAEGKPADHIMTTDMCKACHTTEDWDAAIVDHTQVIGECSSCHDGIIAQGKPEGHIITESECNTCHTTTAWILPGSVGGGVSAADDDDDMDEHPPIGEAMCIDCHNNTIEEGKPDDHIPTSDECGACHSMNDWEPVMTVDHNEVMGVCSDCHNNMIAQGKPPGHIETTSECDTCHNTQAWIGDGTVTPFDHSTLDPDPNVTVCMDCHDGVTATGKPVGHITTQSDCDTCHVTTGWIPAGAGGGTTPFDHSTLTPDTTCVSCHDGTNATGMSATHIMTTSDCKICHNTMLWVPIGTGDPAIPFDHMPLDPALGCMVCHDGAIATGQSATHIATMLECDTCHVVGAPWSPIGTGDPAIPFDHTPLETTLGCIACHDGTIATGKSATHVNTESECDTCHMTTTWIITPV